MSRRSNHQLTEDYLRWLEPQLRDEHGNPEKSYWGLTTILFGRPFEWSVPMDANRLGDGLDLRVEFCNTQSLRPIALNFLGPCTFLEVLLGLSRRMAFIAGGGAPGWAWQLLTNLELHRMSDPLTGARRNRIEEIMTTVIERTYSPDGTGGFFPLSWPEEDMTRIELWYQLHAYVGELHPEY